MNDLDLYFNRVLPVIGRQLEDKRIAFFNLELTHLIADAFARCGVRNMLFVDSAVAQASGPFVLSYGQKYSGQKLGQAMSDNITGHNQMIDDWQHSLAEDVSTLDDQSVDLIVAAGSIRDYQALAHINAPLVFFLILSGSPVNSVIMVHHPELPELNTALETIPVNNILSSIDLKHRLIWLEASDLAMNFAKAILLRHSSYERHDLEDLLFQQGKNFVLRGQSQWPWWLQYLNPLNKLDYIQRIFAQRYFVPQAPMTPLQECSVMIIGCGTASLLANELVNYCRKLFLVDPKKFSTFNPVRQLLGTTATGQSKPQAIADHLIDKVRGSANPKLLLGTSRQKISEREAGSLQVFEDILDSWQPDLVVVATGRTYDDNYTICEILRRRDIKHVIPSAFPGATHYKNIVVDGSDGPCYECIRGNTGLDYADSVDLNSDVREMFYTDIDDPTQPATIFETWPSTHSLLRLSIELLLDPALRSEWFNSRLVQEMTCFVGANMAEKTDKNAYAYGVSLPGQMVVYGMDDLIRVDEDIYTCPSCQKHYSVKHKINTEGS